MGDYVKYSKKIFAILREYTPLVEPLSIDEAFLDLTGTHLALGAPEAIDWTDSTTSGETAAASTWICSSDSPAKGA